MTVLGLEVVSRLPDGAARSTPLLFVHGAFAAAWCWEEHFLPWFAARGYAAHALSLRGHGGSDGHESLQQLGIDDYVEDVRRVVETLPGPPVLIGHSMGGFIVQKYLESGPAAAAVLLAPVPPTGLLGPGASLAIWNPAMFWQIGAVQAFGSAWASHERTHDALFSSSVAKADSARHFARMGPESMRATLDMAGANLPDLRRIAAVPVLVLGAGEDALISPAFVRATARAFGIEAEIFPGMAHGMMLEPGWEGVAERILNWLLKQEL